MHECKKKKKKEKEKTEQAAPLVGTQPSSKNTVVLEGRNRNEPPLPKGKLLFKFPVSRSSRKLEGKSIFAAQS